MFIYIAKKLLWLYNKIKDIITEDVSPETSLNMKAEVSSDSSYMGQTEFEYNKYFN